MKELESWLRFSRVDTSARRGRALLERFGGPAQVLDAPRDRLEGIGRDAEALIKRIAFAREKDVSEELAAMEQLGIRLFPCADPGFPAALQQIPDPPCCLYVRGELREEDRFAIAIVGTRRPTPYGEEMAAQLARDLARRGLTIVSGLAYGIDTCAHHAALDAGGRTIAVLGCGVNIAYPRSNAKLLEEIPLSGAVVSEFGIGAPPESWRFPARNRIISGLSRGVIVVDAPSDSGALITADFALEQGREVFAVPGPIHAPSSKGAHKLLREGATLVESADDVLDALGIEVTPSAAPVEESNTAIPKDLDPNSKKLLCVLSLEPMHTDALARETSLSAAEVGTALMLLEIRGVIRRLPGSRYVRTSFRN